MQRDEYAGPTADWDLLCAGAANPIGNLRIKEAHAWVMAHTAGPGRGFTIDEVAARAEHFYEYMAQHGLLIGIARRMRWEHDDGAAPRWASVIGQAAQASGIDTRVLTQAVRAMAAPLARLIDEATALGIGDVLATRRTMLENNLQKLRQL